MRLLFAHDHAFVTCEEAVYSAGRFPYAAWTRYLNVFNDLLVVGRNGGHVASTTGLSRADGARVSFHLLGPHAPMDALVGAGRRASAVADLIKSADAVAARLPSFVGLVAAEAALRNGTPLAVEVVGCARDAMMATGTVPSIILAQTLPLRMRRAVRKADAVIYVTDEYLQSRYPTQGYHAVCSNVMLPAVSEDVLKRRRSESAVIEIGLIATLHRYKGLTTLFKAIAALRREGYDLRVRQIGTGDPSPWLELANRLGIADLVSLEGLKAAGSEVATWLDGLDLYVQPSLTEGMPRALIEAMSRGLPAVGSRVGGIPEILEPSALHRAGDWRDLAGRLRNALTSSAWRDAQSKRNFEYAKRFAPEVLEPLRSHFWAQFGRIAAQRNVAPRAAAR